MSHCPGCGSRLEFQARFCGNCGHDLQSGDDVFLQASVEQELDDSVVIPQSFFRGRNEIMQRAPQLAKDVVNRRGRVWWMIGSPGIGKTALINQLLPFFSKNDFLAVRIAGVPEFASLSYYPFQQAVNKLTGITESTKKKDIPKLLDKLGDYGLSEVDQLYLRHLYPIEIPATINQTLDDSVRLTGMAAAIVHLLQKVADTKPLLLVVDQIQHTDPFTQKLLYTLEAVVEQERILLLLADRRSPQHSAAREHVIVDDLGPLSLTDIIAIARMYARAERLPVEVEEALVDATQGVPLAVFLLVDFLKEKQHIVERGGQWRIGEKNRGLVYPNGLEEILRKRLALMRPHIQELLWLIAVSSNECTLDMLRSIYSYPEYLKEDLEELADKHLVRISTLGNTRRIAFTHNYIRESIYARIPHSGLATLHPKIGMYIQLNDPLNEQMKTWLAVAHMTHQHERSEQTVQFLERAGDTLVGHLQFLLAAQCFTRESQLLREMAREPHREVKSYERKLMYVLYKIGRCHRATGSMENTEKSWRLVASMATTLDAPFLKIETLLDLGEFFMKHNRGEDAKGCFDDAWATAEATGDAAAMSLVALKLGEWHRRHGPLADARQRLETARELAEPIDAAVHPKKRWLGAILHTKGLVHMDQKKEKEALARLVAALDRSMSERNIPMLLRSIERLAVLYGQKGDHESGLGFIKLGLRIARDVGDRLSLANLSYQAGRFLMNSADRAEAEIAFYDTLQLCREINWQQGMEMSRMALSKLRKDAR